MGPRLNFPSYEFRTKKEEEKLMIFDEVRKKWVVLTAEELVRQHVLRWLVEDKRYPASLMAVEKEIDVNGLKKRCDIVVYNLEPKPILIIECKAPDVPITQEVFDQAARYNMTLGTDLFMLTNGINHFCCVCDHLNKIYGFLKELPSFPG